MRPIRRLAGKYDTVISADLGVEIVDRVPDAQLHTLLAVHLPNVELPDEYHKLVIDSLIATSNE